MRFRQILSAAALAAFFIFAARSAVRADVRLPALLADGMVLQQRKPVRLWGTADPGETVTVTFRDQTRRATAGPDGRWQVTLKAVKAGGPYTLTVAGKNTVTLHDVLVGEVWVCSGQSNMEFRLSSAQNATEDIAASTDPQLRMFTVARKIADAPVGDVTGTWQSAGPTTSGGFSAVGYYFARALRAARHVPIGILHSSWGGTRIEAWTRKEVLAANASAGRAAAPRSTPTTPTAPSKSPNTPSVLYNGMIAPLTPYTIEGVAWYQGEYNPAKAQEYRRQLPDMIQNWRDDWGIPQFPFLIVQLAPYMAIAPEPTDSDWARLREAQYLATYALPNVGMAVIDDVGDAKSIHPTRKAPVGERLALLARRMAYGEKIVAQGPVYKQKKIAGDHILLTFDSVGGGLTARATDSNDQPVDPGKLVGFAVAGADGAFVWADAKIIGKDRVAVSAATVPHPTTVRFGWANFPVVNLYNAEGLPAVPFRTDVQ